MTPPENKTQVMYFTFNIQGIYYNFTKLYRRILKNNKKSTGNTFERSDTFSKRSAFGNKFIKLSVSGATFRFNNFVFASLGSVSGHPCISPSFHYSVLRNKPVN